MDGPSKQLLELALIENIQRENLNPSTRRSRIGVSRTTSALTQDQIAAAVGKDRSSIANFMRLLKLPDEVRADLVVGRAVDGPRACAARLPIDAAQRQAAREVISRVCRSAKPNRWSRSSAPPKQDAQAGARPTNAEPPRMFTRARPRIGCGSRSAPGPDRPARQRGTHRDRFRLGRRAESHLRASSTGKVGFAARKRPAVPRTPVFRGINQMLVPFRYKRRSSLRSRREGLGGFAGIPPSRPASRT